MKMHESMEKKEKFIELRGTLEMSLDKCTEELKVSKPTLLKWEKELTESITDLEKAKFSLLIDSLELGMSSRLERLKELNEAMMNEIKQRDLQEIPSEKLIRLYLDCEGKIESIIDKNNFKSSLTQVNRPQTIEEYIFSLTSENENDESDLSFTNP